MKKTREQLLIEKFLKVPENDKKFWGREMVLLSRLKKKYSIEFLEFVVLGFKLNSLFFFGTKQGKEILQKEKKKFDLLNRQEEPKYTFEESNYEREFQKKVSLKNKLGL